MRRLKERGLREAELYDAIGRFQHRLDLTSAGWLVLLRTYPSRYFRSLLHLSSLRSEHHVAELLADE